MRTLVLQGDALRAATPATIREPLAAAVVERQALRLLRAAVLEVLGKYALDAGDDTGAVPSPAPASSSSSSATSSGAKSIADRRLAVVERSNPVHAALARRLIARERTLINATLALLDAAIAALS